ncbi:hypothetical protein [Stenotrophobium rhamnosiphilum]|uniref:Uncharacterized protein n=1 Tax=Stenotrophobium rhamnosiphilum TaxID=2029166 RepID=A0A2T5MEF3_9GAMM|nr:hypothetical protein [Stenotrophobium rhamnosiphilum]PTU30958.1 hypothetical protein CJD38_11670 [Stenotrophobium rhamnosiphilum]
MSYKTDRAWGDLLIKEAVRLIAPHIIVVAPDIVDRSHASDLVVLDSARGGIAYRCRRTNSWSSRYQSQFTLRYWRASGAATEFKKIMDGYAAWMFYSWSDGEHFTRWFLLDLNVLRATLEGVDEERLDITINKDGKSSFVAFNLEDFPPEMVIDEYTEEASYEQLAA